MMFKMYQGKKKLLKKRGKYWPELGFWDGLTKGKEK